MWFVRCSSKRKVCSSSGTICEHDTNFFPLKYTYKEHAEMIWQINDQSENLTDMKWEMMWFIYGHMNEMRNVKRCLMKTTDQVKRKKKNKVDWNEKRNVMND